MTSRNHFISIIIILLFVSASGISQIDSAIINKRTLPLGRSLLPDKDIALPLPFGVSSFFTYMSRGVDIHNVDIGYQDMPKQSINDIASFELNNKSTVAAVKLDAWILPFVNVYGLAGFVTTDASLDATITVDRILPGPPIIIPISNNSTINGNYFGIGTTCVGGYGAWFMLGDVNYGYSKLDEFEGKIDFWMYSARSGFQAQVGKNNLRSWVGTMYLSSKRTLHLNVEDDILGKIQVDVYQRTINPWTIQVGTSFSFYENFEILCELGANFEDASLGVLSASYRF